MDIMNPVKDYHNHDYDKHAYDKIKLEIRNRKVRLLDYVLRYPFLEQREWTIKYTSDIDGTDDGIRYNFYMKVLFDMLIDTFEASHCANFPDHPCSTICPYCMERIGELFNVEKTLETHMSWWLVHSPYYQERHAVFCQYLLQVTETLPDTFI